MSTARTKANRKYNEKAYDRIALSVKKGDRERIRAHAESKGMSLNGYINDLIKKDMEQGAAD